MTSSTQTRRTKTLKEQRAERQSEEDRRRATDELVDDGRRRYFDTRYQATVVKVLPGEHYVTRNPGEMLVTVLGSCVTACMRDPVTGRGGMNHFMAPESSTGTWSGMSAEERYGNFAMEKLINAILGTSGRRDRLEVKLFGGANVIRSSFRVGSENIDFVRDYVQREGLNVIGDDLGGELPRRIHYYPVTGKAYRLFLRRSADSEIFKQELKVTSALRGSDTGGEVELFE